jgi:hypothetical protein
MPSLPAIVIATTVVVATASPARADDRPLSTDRPDRTESAFTVPRGRWQLEMDLASGAHHRAATENNGGTISGGEKVEALDVAPFNLKLGITDRADVQLLLALWSRTRTTFPDGKRLHDEGAGDVTTRVKLNVIGNDEGRWALAMMPFVSVPTRGPERGRIGSSGLLVPLALDLGADRGLGAMVAIEKERGLDPWLAGSLTVSSPLAKALGGFLEIYAARAGFEHSAPADVTVDSGITFAPHADVQLDAGVYRGLSDDAEDWRLFAGLAVRR